MLGTATLRTRRKFCRAYRALSPSRFRSFPTRCATWWATRTSSAASRTRSRTNRPCRLLRSNGSGAASSTLWRAGTTRRTSRSNSARRCLRRPPPASMTLSPTRPGSCASPMDFVSSNAGPSNAAWASCHGGWRSFSSSTHPLDSRAWTIWHRSTGIATTSPGWSARCSRSSSATTRPR